MINAEDTHDPGTEERAGIAIDILAKVVKFLGASGGNRDVVVAVVEKVCQSASIEEYPDAKGINFKSASIASSDLNALRKSAKLGELLATNNSRTGSGSAANSAAGNIPQALKKKLEGEAMKELKDAQSAMTEWSQKEIGSTGGGAAPGEAHIAMTGLNHIMIGLGVFVCGGVAFGTKLGNERIKYTDAVVENMSDQQKWLMYFFMSGWRQGSLRSAAYGACAKLDGALRNGNVGGFFVGIDPDLAIHSGLVVEGSIAHKVMRAHEVFLGTLNPTSHHFLGEEWRAAWTKVSVAHANATMGSKEKGDWKAKKTAMARCFYSCGYNGDCSKETMMKLATGQMSAKASEGGAAAVPTAAKPTAAPAQTAIEKLAANLP